MSKSLSLNLVFLFFEILEYLYPFIIGICHIYSIQFVYEDSRGQYHFSLSTAGISEREEQLPPGIENLNRIEMGIGDIDMIF
jgi:hypothetical protein